MAATGHLLRAYQLQIKAQLLSVWKECRNVMIQMPTGTGKTHLLASVINDELESIDRRSAGTGRDTSVWIIAHRRELVEQIEDTVARYGIPETDRRLQVMSIQWLQRHWEDMTTTPELIVIDEAHHALAETYRELWVRYPETRKLGMTATPCRLNRRGFTDLFDRLITADSIADFIRQGWLVAFDYVSIKPDSEDQRMVSHLSKRGADGDYQVKEMNAVLNKRPAIERLYDSVRQYADGKKGITYAVSIAHARHIAAYYSAHGINATAIDSKTPAGERKRLVDDFKAGSIQVLVNVDVFSEGFDCPDVEFIQMARPTLSLAKYLQQVGRGLRKSDGKDRCMMIDNVGLYRMFGLPVADRDWQAMFEGRMAGKGDANMACTAYSIAAGNGELFGSASQDSGLELVMTHDRLMAFLNNGGKLYPDIGGKDCLKGFKDRTSGLFGLKRGEKITAMPQYTEIIDTDHELAAVRFADRSVGIVDECGHISIMARKNKKVRFLKDRILSVTDRQNVTYYVDLYNGKRYAQKPMVMNFGQVQLLETGGMYYSRTKILYQNRWNAGNQNMYRHSFYLRIQDFYSEPVCRQVNSGEPGSRHGSVCLLAGDHDTYYHYCGTLPDGSIVVADTHGKYYLAAEGQPRQYIACEHPETVDEDFDTVVARLKAEAEKRVALRKTEEKAYARRRREERLAGLRQATPFKSGLKWGLKTEDKVIVPPIYRNILTPVGNYCAFEEHPQQWGVLMLDGKIVIEARYAKVEIADNGTAQLTIVPGKVKTVKLQK